MNSFQRTMLHWRELHPYNGVHALKVAHPLDLGRLEETIQDELEWHGLTNLRLDQRTRRFHYDGGRVPIHVKCRQGTPDPPASLSSEIEEQLNAPFPKTGRVTPFRFFVVEDGHSFYLGLAYDHFVAGGESILQLLKRLVDRYPRGRADTEAPPLSLYPETFRSLALRQPFIALRAAATLPATVAKVRRSFRPRSPRSRDCSNAYMPVSIAPPQLSSLIDAAKRWGVTVNDLFLALLLRVLSPVASGRTRSKRRRQIAVASIVSVRQDFQQTATEMFGQFLGSFSVAHPVPPGVSLADLVRDVHRQTTAIKKQKRYAHTVLMGGLSNFLWRFLSEEHRHGWHRKHHPLWGGITTLNVNALWQRDEGRTVPEDYWRAGSTGPATPLVLALTTVQGRLNVGVTVRRDAFSPSIVENMIGEFTRSIDML